MRSTPGIILALVGSLVAGCSGDEPEVASHQPAGWADEVRLPEAVDESPDPHVVEIHLEARVASVEIVPGKPTEVWTYDGGIPGPLIHARAGDRLIVHFTNHLPEETTVHWHGVRVPVQMDGMPGVSGPSVPPGGSFDYDFVVPDAGLYWYHPHFDSATQVGSGLYGAILVDDPEEPADIAEEAVLVLSDIGLDADGALQPPDVSGELGALFGREGGILLANGRVRPTLHPRAGVRQRWRLVNAARSRYFQLELAGDRFLRIGGDGGRIGAPIESDRLVLTPGQRADVLVTPHVGPGAEAALRWIPFDRGYGTAEFREPVDVIAIHPIDDAPGASPALPSLGRKIAPLSLSGATPVDLELTQVEVDGHFVLGINGVPFDQAEPLHGHIGETQVWTLKNTMKWSHPMHVHGFFFQELGDSGAPVIPIEWRDTLDVPYEKTARFAIRYEDRPGMWMFHCHILDHAELGMMGSLMLEP